MNKTTITYIAIILVFTAWGFWYKKKRLELSNRARQFNIGAMITYSLQTIMNWMMLLFQYRTNPNFANTLSPEIKEFVVTITKNADLFKQGKLPTTGLFETFKLAVTFFGSSLKEMLEVAGTGKTNIIAETQIATYVISAISVWFVFKITNKDAKEVIKATNARREELEKAIVEKITDEWNRLIPRDKKGIQGIDNAARIIHSVLVDFKDKIAEAGLKEVFTPGYFKSILQTFFDESKPKDKRIVKQVD